MSRELPTISSRPTARLRASLHASWRTMIIIAAVLAGGFVHSAVGAAIAEPEAPTIFTQRQFWETRRSAEARRTHPVRLEFVVSYYDPAWHLLWVEQNDECAFLPVARVVLPLRSRQRVRVEGEAIPAEGLHAEKVRVTVLEPEVPSQPLMGNGRLLDLARNHRTSVSVRAYVETQMEVDPNHLRLELVVDDTRVSGTVWLDDGEPVPALTGQIIHAVGVSTIPAERALGSAELQLWITNTRNILVADDPRIAELFALPETSLDELGSRDLDTYVRVLGRLGTGGADGAREVQTSTGALELRTPLGSDLTAGASVEVIGRPVKRAAHWTLRDVVLRERRTPEATAHVAGATLPKMRLAEQVLLLMHDEAARGYPVELAGVVTFSHPVYRVLFLQDASGGLCVNYEGLRIAHPAAGDLVTVTGRTTPGGFASMVQADGIVSGGKTTFPAARPVTLEHALTGVEDAQWVEMRGFLRHVEMRQGLAYLTVVAAGGEFIMRVPASEPPTITLGSVLRASGVCASKPNAKRQLISVDLLVPSLDQLIVDAAAPADPFSRPLREIGSLRRYQPVQTLDQQVRINGVVLHHVPGRMLLVQGEGEVLRVFSRDPAPLVPGDRVDVVGVPGRLAAQLVLREAIYRRTSHGEEPQPLQLTDDTGFSEELDGRLVQLEGVLLDVAAHADETRLFVQTGANITEVVFDQAITSAAGAHWAAGARVKLSGIYRVQYDEYDQAKEFNVQLRDMQDLAVLSAPPWWTANRALTIAGALLGLAVIALAWAGTLRRRVRDQTNVIRAQLENEANLEARHRDIIENASDFILTLDLNGRFTSFNPAGEQLTGYSRSAAMRLSFYDLLSKRDERLVRWTLERPENRRELVGFQTQLIRRDGSRIWVEANARFVRHDGRCIGVLGIVRDISGRKQVEEELKLARDAAEANTRAKSLFLANMSHEIRTPMNGVIGMSHLLLDTKLDEQQRDFTETIRNSAESLLTVLNDILDFSKIEAGHLQFEQIEFPLGETVDDALELLAARAAAKGLELAAFLPPDLPPRLRGDPGRLRQILINLIGNAVKFTDRGEITVRVSREAESAGKINLRFAVTDTGVGIPEEVRQHLFQAFHQADNSMTRKFGGTGLGLAISKQIVELMHGQIGVESTPGKGSTFWFTVAFDTVNTGAASADASPEAVWYGARVLVVDDHVVNREVVQHGLERHGARVIAAGDAAAALAIARDAAARGERPQLILLDQHMPDLDGVTLAREIHGDPQLADVPLVLLTTVVRPISAEVRDAAGIVACLTKPIRQSELLKVLCRHGRRPLESPLLEANGSTAVTPPTIGETPADFSALRVLVAEDNVVNQRLTCLQLQKLGLHADIAADGREVLEAVERVPYDVILMDCQMPDVDGFAATRRLRANLRHAGIHIIAMTANAMTGDRERCLEVGMNDYLSKPTRLDDLRAALQRAAAPAPRGNAG